MILYDHIHKVRKQKHVAGIKNIPKRCKKICISMYIIYIATYANIYTYREREGEIKKDHIE